MNTYKVIFWFGDPILQKAENADKAAVLAAAEKINKGLPYGVFMVQNEDGSTCKEKCMGAFGAFGILKSNAG